MVTSALSSNRFWRYWSTSLALLAIGLGFVGLFGWIADSFALRSFLSVNATMKFDTALLLIACGTGLCLLNFTKSVATPFLLTITIGFCAMIIIEHLFKIELNIDEWWFKDTDTNPLTETPGRTSLLTSATAFCMAFAMLLAFAKRYYISQALCGLVLILIYSALLGHIFHSAEFYRQGRYSGVALHTALALLFLNLGILCYQYKQGWLQLFSSNTRGRYVFLYILCYLLCIAPLLIAFYLFMSHHDQFSPASGVIFMVVLSALISIPIAYLILSRIVLIDSDLKKANQRLEIALETAKLGSYDVDINSGNMYCTVQCKANFGLEPEAIFNLPDLMQMIVPEHKGYVESQINTAIRNNTTYNAEYQITWPDGSTHWINASGKVQYEMDGQAKSIIGVTSDITNQKETDMRKNAFIGIVSHELKTPLTSLKAFIQILHKRATKEGRETESGIFTKVELQVNKMSNMINGFLNVSRLESGKIYLSKSVFDVAELVQELAEENRIMQNTHEIIIKSSPRVGIYADREKIAQVINNLISNAVKYSSQAKQVFIDCHLLDEQVHISIQDNGIGIPAQYLDKLFDRFYRVDNPDTRNISGFGIGLYLCAEIIKRHAGTISVKSEPGTGSTFHFTLPLRAVAESM